MCSLSSFAALDLVDAVNQKKVSVKFTYSSLGKDGMKLTVTNLTVGQLSLTVTPGTIFIPEDDGEQTLMTVEEALIALAPQKTASKLVGGYCIMLSKHAPNLGRSFKIGRVSNQNLISFLDFVKTNPVSKDNYQSAIWSISDNEDIASIDPINEADKKLREFIAKMTNRKNPWYSKPQQITVNPGQLIERKSVNINGILEVKVTESYDVYVVVENSKGEVKMKLPVMSLDKNSDNSFQFKVEASRWEVGDYKVVIRKVSDNKEVKRFDFKV
jgi:hypothetical protein